MVIEKRKKLGDAVETVKTVLLALLVASLIMLIIVYIGGTHIYQSMTDAGEKKNFDKLWSVQGTANTDGLSSERLLPEIIGYKPTGAGAVATIADGDAVSELYRLITPCLLELFGDDSGCEPLENGAVVFKEAAAGSEYIYLRYHEPVLYQLIYAYASDKPTIGAGDVAVMKDSANGAYVSELIIIPDKDFAGHRFIAYACDGDGDYYEFRQNEGIVVSIFHISKLTDSALSIDTLPFAIAGDDSLCAGQPLIDAELETEDITYEPVPTLGTGITFPLMRLFGYNPDKLSGAVDENGVGNYYDSHSRIWLENGAFTYFAFDASTGLKLDRLLGYSVGDTLTLFDKLTAVDNLISGIRDISPSLVGGEAALCLGEVYYEDGMLVLEYFNTFDNVRIAGDPAIRAVLAQETLYNFELSAKSYKGTDSTSFAPSQSYVLRKLTETGKLTGSETGLCMRFAYRGAKAGWSVEYSSGADAKPEPMMSNFRLR